MEQRGNQSETCDFELLRSRLHHSHFGTFHIQDPEIAKKREESLLNKRANEIMKRFNKGFEAILEEVTHQEKEGIFAASDESDPISVVEVEMKQEVKRIAGNINTWKKQLNHLQKLQTLFGYSDNVVLNFYDVASNFLVKKQYDDALNAFTFLCMINPYVSSFWIGQGLCFEADHHYTLAIESFEMAIEADPSDFDPFLGMIRCSEQIKDYDTVIELLEVATENPATEEEAKEALEYIASVNR